MPRRFGVRDADCAHFITSAVRYWIGLFCRDDYFRVLADSFCHCCRERGLLVHCYVFMTSHFHAICSAERRDLPDVVRDLKKFTAKELARKLEEDHRTVWLSALRKAAPGEGGISVWQPEYHPVEIRSPRFLAQRMGYIHDNPVRAGYVADAVSWKYSSAGFYYLEQPGPVPVTALCW